MKTVWSEILAAGTRTHYVRCSHWKVNWKLPDKVINCMIVSVLINKHQTITNSSFNLETLGLSCGFVLVINYWNNNYKKETKQLFFPTGNVLLPSLFYKNTTDSFYRDIELILPWSCDNLISPRWPGSNFLFCPSRSLPAWRAGKRTSDVRSNMFSTCSYLLVVQLVCAAWMTTKAERKYCHHRELGNTRFIKNDNNNTCFSQSPC